MTDWIPNHHHFVTAGAALASSETALSDDHLTSVKVAT